MGQRLPLQTVYRLIVCIWLKQEAYSIKKKDTVSAAQIVRNLCPPRLLWNVHGYMESCCWGDELPIPPTSAEQSYPTLWVGLRNLSAKSSTFSLCGCYFLPYRNGVKSVLPVSVHMLLPPPSYTEAWRTDIMLPSAALSCRSWVAQSKSHTVISSRCPPWDPICSTT